MRIVVSESRCQVRPGADCVGSKLSQQVCGLPTDGRVWGRQQVCEKWDGRRVAELLRHLSLVNRIFAREFVLPIGRRAASEKWFTAGPPTDSRRWFKPRRCGDHGNQDQTD